MAFLFPENRRHGTDDRQTEGRRTHAIKMTSSTYGVKQWY